MTDCRTTRARTRSHSHRFFYCSSYRFGNSQRRGHRRHGFVFEMVFVEVYQNQKRLRPILMFCALKFWSPFVYSLRRSKSFPSTVPIGQNKDVVLSRSGPKQLNINSAVKIEGIVDVKALKINGKPFSGQCKCSGGGSVLAPIKESCGSDCKACSKAKIWADGALCLYTVIMAMEHFCMVEQYIL